MAQSPKLIVTRVDTSSEEEIKMAWIQGEVLGTWWLRERRDHPRMSQRLNFLLILLFPPRPTSRPKLAKEEEEGKRDRGKGVCPTKRPTTAENEQRETKGDFGGEQGGFFEGRGAPTTAHLVPQARARWRPHPLGCRSPKLSIGAFGLCCQSPWAAISSSQRYGCLQALQAARPLPVPEEGPCYGKWFDITWN